MVLADSTVPISEEKVTAKRKSRARAQPSIDHKDAKDKLGMRTTK